MAVNVKQAKYEAVESIKPGAQAGGERIDRKEERVITGDSGDSSAAAPLARAIGCPSFMLSPACAGQERQLG